MFCFRISSLRLIIFLHYLTKTARQIDLAVSHFYRCNRHKHRTFIILVWVLVHIRHYRLQRVHYSMVSYHLIVFHKDQQLHLHLQLISHPIKSMLYNKQTKNYNESNVYDILLLFYLSRFYSVYFLEQLLNTVVNLLRNSPMKIQRNRGISIQRIHQQYVRFVHFLRVFGYSMVSYFLVV